MLPIQFTDLKSQYIIIKDEIDLAIAGVLNHAAFIQGPEVKQFESELTSYFNLKYSIGCANGTDALQISMMALDLHKDDEVIIPAFTFISPIEAAALVGLKIVLADVDPENFTISTKSITKVITNKTKLIVPVHLYGQCSDMEEILAIANKNNLFVIEDAAQCLGSEYKFSNGETHFSGTMGHLGTTSFFPTKNLGCFGDGGAIFTNDSELASKVRMICNHGQMKKYVHEVIGLNSRLDTLQAAVLSTKLKYLETYSKKRNDVANFYDQAFKNHSNLVIPNRNNSATHVFNQYTIQVSDGRRDKLRNHLAEKGIPTMIYYPIPLHLQKAYQYLGYKKGDFPIAEKLSENVLSLPIHTNLDIEQLSYISETILNFYK